MSQRAVFLDRDGVLNIEAGYIYRVEDLHLVPGVAKAVRQFNDQGLFCCLVSNQSGPARGYYPQSHVDALHDRLCDLLKHEANARLDALHYCPDLSPMEGGIVPEFTRWTTWRKPNTGMLAHNAGCTGILVQTGYGDRVLSGDYQHKTRPDYIARDLADAADWITQQLASQELYSSSKKPSSSS
jgi:D-glycero-D-manno-heptose 1,7-bisphosphate phosphatase